MEINSNNKAFILLKKVIYKFIDKSCKKLVILKYFKPAYIDVSLMGFTLIELMLVVIIIGVLAAMVLPRLAGRSEQAREAAAQVDIEANIATALDLYELDNGQYPITEQGLNALVKKPTSSPLPNNWRGPYLKKEPLDPWRRSYMYRFPGEHNPEDYDLASWGRDGLEGGSDDMVNW